MLDHSYNTESGIIELRPAGRIDTNNAAQFEHEAFALIAEKGASGLILDCDALKYVSSAGLRVILKLRQRFADAKLINVSSEVYEILEMTGFTEMMSVTKGYRKLSVDGCEVVGKGANGTVFSISDDIIVKVYNSADALPDIQHERELARRAFILGVPTAIPYDVVKVGDKFGSVFELLSARSLAQILQADPSRLDEAVAISTALLKTIHSTVVRPTDMPDQREVVLGWTDFLKDYLEPAKWEKLHALVEAVPVSHTMIHGDYHIKNVMVQNGESLLIDMDTLCQGDPVFEFASIYNAYVGFYMPDRQDGVKDFLGITYPLSEAFWRKTLILYFGTEDEEKLTAIENKAKLLGFTRLMRRLIRRHGLETEEGRSRVAYYKEQIEALVDEIDSLCF